VKTASSRNVCQSADNFDWMCCTVTCLSTPARNAIVRAS